MDQNDPETTQRCMACNRVIFDAAKSCKCGHVNEAMRTIAGKRFSGYREELYTRRVIKESRDEYRRMRRESLGIRKRQRKSSTPEKLRLRRRRKRLDDMRPITSDSPNQLIGGFDYHDNNTHLQDITADQSKDALKPRDDLENDATYVDSSISYAVDECPSDEQHHPKTKPLPHKQEPRRTTLNQDNRKPGENKTKIIRPMKQFAIAGPLAEINKRLMNQSGIWMCLGDSFGFGKPNAADVVDVF